MNRTVLVFFVVVVVTRALSLSFLLFCVDKCLADERFHVAIEIVSFPLRSCYVGFVLYCFVINIVR